MNPRKYEDDLELRELLKQGVSPAVNAELSRDLWPRMLARLSGQSASLPWHASIPWFDWALAVLAVAALVVFPGIIPALFYHF